MIHLMNSAMMPEEGVYYCKKVSSEKIRDLFLIRCGQKREPYKSYIGYPNSAAVLSELLGVEIPLSRERTVLEDGETAFAMRLRYRVAPASKAMNKHGEKLEDYDFFVIRYFSFPL